MANMSLVEGQKEVHLDLADDDEAHIVEAVRLRIHRQIFIVHLYLILTQVLDEEAVLGNVPRNLCMLLADCILVGQTEVVRIVSSLLPANVDL